MWATTLGVFNWNLYRFAEPLILKSGDCHASFKRMEPRVAFSEVIQTVNTIGNHIQWWDDCRKDLNYLISGGRWWLHRDWKSEEVPTIQLASSSKRSTDVQELLDNPGARGERAGRASCASTPGLLLMLKTHRRR